MIKKTIKVTDSASATCNHKSFWEGVMGKNIWLSTAHLVGTKSIVRDYQSSVIL